MLEVERLLTQAGTLQDKTFLALSQWFLWWLWMDPTCRLIKQIHNPECRHSVKSILFNFLKYLHIAWSNGRAGVIPMTVLRGFAWFTSLPAWVSTPWLPDLGASGEGSVGFAGALCLQGVARWDKHQPGREFKEV